MKAKIYTTELCGGEAVQQQRTLRFAAEKSNQETQVINLYPEVKYQEIAGFGGAVTDAVAATLEQMGEQEQREILEGYFGENGIGYRFIRTSIDSCDFSRGQYCAYKDGGKSSLDIEALEQGAGAVIKYLKRIGEITQDKIEVMISPWSPPAELKTNQSRTEGGRLKKEAYQSWADYICAYILEYQRRGIPVTMLSVQNEPNASQTWDSCLFTPKEEKEFLRDYLHPALQNNSLQDIQIFIWDHNKERIYERTKEIVDDETDGMVDGVAFHWYSGDHFEGVQLVREKYPDKKLLFSEGCIEYSRFSADNQLRNAQLYAHDMIGNFNAGMNLFLDWNIVLDQDGGPNYVNNLCESPIMCDVKKNRYHKNLSFSYLELFSRYIRPGARRIAYTKYSSELDVLSVKNPDGAITVILCNRSSHTEHIYLRVAGNIAECDIPAAGIGAIVIEIEYNLK